MYIFIISSPKLWSLKNTLVSKSPGTSEYSCKEMVEGGEHWSQQTHQSYADRAGIAPLEQSALVRTGDRSQGFGV